MARLSDHDVRDAEDRLRKEISMVLAQYGRRMAERGKAYITEAIAKAVKDGDEINGPAIGRTAANKVIAEYFAASKPEAAIESPATPELPDRITHNGPPHE